MVRLPRLAAGVIQPGVDSRAIFAALLESLRREGIHVQGFLSRACFSGNAGATTVMGPAPRHLDSWLMTPDICRELFLRGASTADLAIVEGDFSSADEAGIGGQLEPLCQWLDLPRVAVIDASDLDQCRLPPRPRETAGLLLDRVADELHLARLITDLEALWGIPVLGALGRLPRLRAALAAVPEGDRLPQCLCEELGDQFTRYWQPRRLLEIAGRRESPRCACRQLGLRRFSRRPMVAVAYDEAFHCYFPDTLDLLERLGASVADFSPLHDENLPAGADVVYLGCGHPERYAAALSENHCMKAALRNHLRSGRRIYAEGAAAAYLCQQMETCSGELQRMVGILPATARLAASPRHPRPVEVTLSRPNWLGQHGARLRGYQNGKWRFDPVAADAGFVQEPQHRFDVIGCHQAIGSLLHLDFAVQPSFLQQFFTAPVTPSVTPDPWSPVA